MHTPTHLYTTHLQTRARTHIHRVLTHTHALSHTHTHTHTHQCPKLRFSFVDSPDALNSQKKTAHSGRTPPKIVHAVAVMRTLNFGHCTRTHTPTKHHCCLQQYDVHIKSTNNIAISLVQRITWLLPLVHNLVLFKPNHGFYHTVHQDIIHWLFMIFFIVKLCMPMNIHWILQRKPVLLKKFKRKLEVTLVLCEG